MILHEKEFIRRRNYNSEIKLPEVKKIHKIAALKILHKIECQTRYCWHESRYLTRYYGRNRDVFISGGLDRRSSVLSYALFPCVTGTKFLALPEMLSYRIFSIFLLANIRVFPLFTIIAHNLLQCT